MDNLGNVGKIVEAIKSNVEEQFFFIPWIGKNYERGLFGKRILVVGASHYCLHTNKCYRPTDNKDCPSFFAENCKKGCQFFGDCTVRHTKKYNDKCKWMNAEHSCLYDGLCHMIDEKIENEGISKRLNSATLDEVCNFLDPSCPDNVSFSKFTNYLFSYIAKKIRKECPKENLSVQAKIVVWERIAFVNYAQNFQPNTTGNNFQPDDFTAFKSYIEILNPDVVIVWGCALGGELEKKGCKVKATEYGYIWENQEFNNVIFLNSYHPSYSGFADGGRLDSAMDKVLK